MRKDASVSLQQLRACLRAHERLLDEDWPEAAWSSASESDDEEENPRQAHRRLNPPVSDSLRDACSFKHFMVRFYGYLQAGDPLKERNSVPLWSTESSEVLVAQDPPLHHEKEVQFSDVPQMDGDHWTDVPGAPLSQPTHHVPGHYAPQQYEFAAHKGSRVEIPHQDHYGCSHGTSELVDGTVSSQQVEPRPFHMHNSSAPAQQPMPPLRPDFARLQSALASVNHSSRNPSPDLISEPEINQLDDDINSVKALLQERATVLQPIEAGKTWNVSHSGQQSASMSPSTSLYQKPSRPKVCSTLPYVNQKCSNAYYRWM